MADALIAAQVVLTILVLVGIMIRNRMEARFGPFKSNAALRDHMFLVLFVMIIQQCLLNSLPRTSTAEMLRTVSALVAIYGCLAAIFRGSLFRTR